MQQTENVTDDLRIYHLSPEEVNDPRLVFGKLFKEKDLPELRQLNGGLIRAVMESEAFQKLTQQEQMTFIAFSLQMGRAIEAVHLLHSRTGEQEETANGEKDDAIHLSEAEKEDPFSVLREFTADFSLPSLRSLLSTMTDTCVTSEAVAFAQAGAREDLLYVGKHIFKVFEAMYLLVRKEKQKEGKLIVHDFTPPPNNHSNNA